MPLVNTQDTMHEQRERDNSVVTSLFDPPVDGVTPLDGEGNPRKSEGIYLRDVPAKLKQGFTEEPVGFDAPEPEPAPKAEKKAEAPKAKARK